jgi:hypothetical protein
MEPPLAGDFFMAADLTQLIATNPDPRELKRAVAVQMFLSGLKHWEIQGILSVSSGFISKWTQQYDLGGVSNLKLGHRGSSGYLTILKMICGRVQIEAELLRSVDRSRVELEEAPETQSQN